MKLTALLLFALAVTGCAQDSPGKGAIEWANTLAGRFRSLHDPVVVTHSLARLGLLVCPIDPGTGSQLLQDALTRLRFLTPSSFGRPGPPLPVPSFTALYKLMVPAARKCDPALRQYVDMAASQAKMDEERGAVNSKLQLALQVVEDNPERAAQLAAAAVSAGTTGVLDVATLTLLLSQVRDRAPDLSDDLYPAALDFVVNAPAPDTASLMELGKYLFTAPQYLELPDKSQASEVFEAGSSSIANFQFARHSTDSDDIRAYLDGAVKALGAKQDPNYDPVAGYAIASQMLPYAQDFAPELADPLSALASQLAAQAGSAVDQIQAHLAAAPPDLAGGEKARLRDRAIGQAIAAAKAGRFAEARALLKSLDDQDIRGQVGSLIDFSEAGAAIGGRDLQWAASLTGTLRPGIKRSLLYSALVAALPDRAAAGGYFQIAQKDVEAFPAEQRIPSLAAAADAIRHTDDESALMVLAQIVALSNDALNRPYRGKFDPTIVRKRYNGPIDSFSDSALILFSSKGPHEVVDSGAGRHSFSLKVPGLSAMTLPSLLSRFDKVDPGRVEAILLGLRGETQQATALLALAAVRLKER